MVGMDMVEGVDVVRAGFFVFFRFGCFRNMMGERVVIEIVVHVLVLVWWRQSTV